MSAYFESAVYAERNELMFYYRQLGMPYRMIGAKWDLTTERVRQILAMRSRMVSSLPYVAPSKLDYFLATHNPKAHAARLAAVMADFG